MPYHFYILECTGSHFYIGSCKNLDQRFKAHSQNIGAEFTKRYKPIRIAYHEIFPTRAEAMAREAQVKKWSQAKKQALIAGNMKRLKQLSESHDQRF